MKINHIDQGQEFDWGRTSEDYAKHRKGPPESFYKKLLALGVGHPGQKILDLGTGTGLLARTFAQQGSDVAGTDIAEDQIAMAVKLSAEEKLSIDFKVAAAENQPFEDESFDVITANQCWLYFDKKKVSQEVLRLLKPGGLLVTSHLSWLPRYEPITYLSEKIVLKFNPAWTANDFSGEIPAFPRWAQDAFVLKAMFWYDEGITYDFEGWVGRMRACRGVGAALPAEKVSQFSNELHMELQSITEEPFQVPHRVDAHIFTKDFSMQVV